MACKDVVLHLKRMIGLEFAPRHSARFPDSQVFVAQVPADECRFTKRANDKGQLWDTVIADVNMASYDINRSFYSVIRTDIVEVHKGYEQSKELRVYEMGPNYYMDSDTIPLIKKYKCITQTDRRLRHSLDAADVFTTIDGRPLKLVFEMEHGVMYGYDDTCTDMVEYKTDSGNIISDRAKLEHARNGRMIVTGVCAILSAPMSLPEDKAPTSPRREPPSRKRARDV